MLSRGQGNWDAKLVVAFPCARDATQRYASHTTLSHIANAQRKHRLAVNLSMSAPVLQIAYDREAKL